MVSVLGFCGPPCLDGEFLRLEKAKRSSAVADADPCLPSAALCVKMDAGNAARVVSRKSLVSCVRGLAGGTKVGYPIVCPDSIDVVDLLRSRSVHNDPDDPCDGQVPAIKPYLKVPLCAGMPNWTPCLTVSSGLFSNENPSVWVIMENAAKVFLTWVFDHFMPSIKDLHYGIA